MFLMCMLLVVGGAFASHTNNEYFDVDSKKHIYQQAYANSPFWDDAEEDVYWMSDFYLEHFYNRHTDDFYEGRSSVSHRNSRYDSRVSSSRYSSDRDYYVANSAHGVRTANLDRYDDRYSSDSRRSDDYYYDRDLREFNDRRDFDNRDSRVTKVKDSYYDSYDSDLVLSRTNVLSNDVDGNAIVLEYNEITSDRFDNSVTVFDRPRTAYTYNSRTYERKFAIECHTSAPAGQLFYVKC